MLNSIELKAIGPAPKMSLEFGSRLNLVTGDNGLGKSFILDTAWWVLTRTFARDLPILPLVSPSEARIKYSYAKSSGGDFNFESSFDRVSQKWTVKRARPTIPGMVLYAQVDGGFSVWDPMRNYWKNPNPERPTAFHFQPKEVWEGNAICEGLIRDLATWQREGGRNFKSLQATLKVLSPSTRELLKSGELCRLSVEDPKAYPTIRMPFGHDVPVIHASAGIRRVLALAYLLLWAWQEHEAAAKVLGKEPVREIIFLVDEIEAHLHPQWQRRIVPSLLEVVKKLTDGKVTNVQVIAVTHSPLVMASVESSFDSDRDAWFDLDLESAHVALRKRDYERLGEVGNWLTSVAFDLGAARSLESELALAKAVALAKKTRVNREDVDAVERELQASLGELDRFWMRWNQFREDIGHGRSKKVTKARSSKGTRS